ncbi:MAG: YlxR family protein [Clostridia bacterium]|nr:YlxR family protein [Clostridia bacterium]MBR6650048.1 YlxR family protein [Clostridia bacterium]
MSANKTPKVKKIPQRKCTGCGQSFPKKDLIRVVRSPEGEVSLDFTGKKSGRGAYVCKNAQCFKKAAKANRFRTNLECEIPEEVLVSLEEEITAWEAENK